MIKHMLLVLNLAIIIQNIGTLIEFHPSIVMENTKNQ